MKTLAFDTYIAALYHYRACRAEGVEATPPRWVDPVPHPTSGWTRGGWAVSIP